MCAYRLMLVRWVGPASLALAAVAWVACGAAPATRRVPAGGTLVFDDDLLHALSRSR